MFQQNKNITSEKTSSQDACCIRNPEMHLIINDI